MSWAGQRRLLIVAIIISVLGAIVVAVLIAAYHETPSCTDGKQNQEEEGVDCGGPCSNLCRASVALPSVKFVRQLSQSPGRTDVIAYVENPNPSSAARRVPYTIELYDDENIPVGKRTGTVDLPPASTIPIYVTGITTDNAQVSRAFLTFDTDTATWFRYIDDRAVPKVTRTEFTEGDRPRVNATLSNPSATSLFNFTVIATVFNAENNAIAASQTVVPELRGQGDTVTTFTWSAPFLDAVARIEVIPVILLPAFP